MNKKHLMTEDEADSIRADHPDFRYASHWSTSGFPCVVFERHVYFEPTAEQVTDYRRRQEIVQANGGYMREQEYKIAGETPVFSADDCAAMRKAVEVALPDWQIKDSWNGEGCRSYSVSITQRTSAVSGDNNATP